MARTSKSRGGSGFQMRSGNSSPYKFLGKIGGAIGAGINKLTGAGGGDGGTGGVPIAAAQKAFAGGGGQMGGAPGMGGAPAMGMPTAMMQKEKSPMKATDAQLIQGSRDAATGFGSVSKGITAESRAIGDMVNSVEETVNRSSKAQNAKDRRRQKVQDRSHHKYGKFRERKGEDWYDESADHMHTPPHGF
tara:strand:- start:693 stop:1262 length:570 start_codon:yes stop_codon:yes gene_type:complete